MIPTSLHLNDLCMSKSICVMIVLRSACWFVAAILSSIWLFTVTRNKSYSVQILEVKYLVEYVKSTIVDVIIIMKQDLCMGYLRKMNVNYSGIIGRNISYNEIKFCVYSLQQTPWHDRVISCKL